MSPTRPTIAALPLLAAAGLGAPALGVPVIDNGSMTGPVSTGSPPPGWTAAAGSPDTCDASGPFNNTGSPWTLSPDGGTFTRAVGPSAGSSEAISQTLTDLDVGVSYQVDFFQTNLAFEHPTSGDWWASEGQWEFFLDGGLVASSTAMSPPASAADPNVWEAGSVTFTATATSQELTLAPLKTAGTFAAYMGIDGVRIHEVPAPAPAAAILGAALLGATRRRRRRLA